MGLDIGGIWTEDPERVKGEVRNYFRNLFLRKEWNIAELPEDLVASRLNAADEEMLMQVFSEEEIKQAIWDCDSAKSHGPDGFGMEFYKCCWEIIRVDLVSVFNEFHALGYLAKGCNSSFVALIPKKSGVSSLNNFWPISLIGSLYKILAKVLAKRMKGVMGKLIGSEQSDFIKNRFIFDGVVVLNEAIEVVVQS